MLSNLNHINDTCNMYDIFALHQIRNRGTRFSSFSVPREANVLLFIHNGSILFETPNGTGFTAHTHDIVYIPKGCLYTSTYCEDSTTISSVRFQMKQDGTDFTFSDTIEYLDAVYSSKLEQLFLSFHNNSILHNTVIQRHFKLYGLICRLSEISDEVMMDSKYKLIMPGIDYLTEHFKENIPIKEIAKVAMVSETYFRRLFTFFLHESPIEYRNNMRIEYIDDLISSGQYTITEAVMDAGFSSTNYYYKIRRKSNEKLNSINDIVY